ncbi:hypothetical protein BDF14DRAFT_1778595 [Spinellus fusiger]|nr:hypothetical protein BDF14DRAFT_1778595 [Spinellus fusiger]
MRITIQSIDQDIKMKPPSTIEYSSLMSMASCLSSEEDRLFYTNVIALSTTIQEKIDRLVYCRDHHFYQKHPHYQPTIHHTLLKNMDDQRKNALSIYKRRNVHSSYSSLLKEEVEKESQIERYFQSIDQANVANLYDERFSGSTLVEPVCLSTIIASSEPHTKREIMKSLSSNANTVSTDTKGSFVTMNTSIHEMHASSSTSFNDKKTSLFFQQVQSNLEHQEIQKERMHLNQTYVSNESDDVDSSSTPQPTISTSLSSLNSPTSKEPPQNIHLKPHVSLLCVKKSL